VQRDAFARMTAEEEALLSGLLDRIHDNLTREPGAGER
jgi:hypothetical protein